MSQHTVYKTLRTVPGTWPASHMYVGHYYYFTEKEMEAQKRISDLLKATLLELKQEPRLPFGPLSQSEISKEEAGVDPLSPLRPHSWALSKNGGRDAGISTWV